MRAKKRIKNHPLGIRLIRQFEEQIGKKIGGQLKWQIGRQVEEQIREQLQLHLLIQLYYEPENPEGVEDES